MMAVSTADIKTLREKTGAGMMEVRAALMEAEGDLDKAVEILRQKGAATAEKKASRAVGEGKIAGAVEGNVAVLVEVNCETDFSANNERFVHLVQGSVACALATNTAETEAILAADYQGQALKAHFTDTIGAIKENMTLTRVVRLEAGENGLLQSYIHANQKIGVLVELGATQTATLANPAVAQLAKDLAMQIAAYAPDFATRDEIPQAAVDEETRIEMGKEDIQSKPEAIRGNIVKGRVEKNLAQRVLSLQAFVKDGSKTVAEVIADLSKATGDTVTLCRFVRFALGETMQAEASEAEAVAV
ncbi:MAG: translation elongation factor Ts [Vampirovibrionales bacterium]